MRNFTRTTGAITLGVLTAAAALAGGCQSNSFEARMNRAGAAYDAGDYDTAYREGSTVARNDEGELGDAGAFVAGTAAYRRGDMRSAVTYLQRAVKSNDPAMAGDAGATLGLAYADLGWHHSSAEALLSAAKLLGGEDKARAYFYAAVSQQKMGRWAQARTNLILARGTTADEAFQGKCDDQLRVTGYTLQTGEYRTAADAEQASTSLQERSLPLDIGKSRVTPAQHGEATVMSVQVGEFSSFDSARQARSRLGEKQAAIVPLMSQ